MPIRRKAAPDRMVHSRAYLEKKTKPEYRLIVIIAYGISRITGALQ